MLFEAEDTSFLLILQGKQRTRRWARLLRLVAVRADLACIMSFTLGTYFALGTVLVLGRRAGWQSPHPHESYIPLGKAGKQVSKPVASNKG